MLRPHRRKAGTLPPEPANDRPWEQAPDWTAKEKFWAVLGLVIKFGFTGMKGFVAGLLEHGLLPAWCGAGGLSFQHMPARRCQSCPAAGRPSTRRRRRG